MNEISPHASPALASDLAGLPPCFMMSGTLDLFLEEDLEYARRLIRAGVPTELHIYPGAFHAFDFQKDADVTGQFRVDSLAALRRSLKM
ncbi:MULTISPECIES: alpha/beta hydrolase [Rhizobium]|uniref:Alpha/beta hydrolase fold n=1 Tax=Rhizobium miluonense TaxID=411945 RepID=A0A1C3UZJ8_9HYPH|nr:alpha/beta hydrolase fold domain-containing protein [Rhizobium miluonense]SCB20855.1 alpha/beta hydrolase fold [Rhizobium miluonense]